MGGEDREYRMTRYFQNEVLRKRSYLSFEWCTRILESPMRVEVQNDGRVRHWGAIAELGGRIVRVVTLEDRLTIHNAFIDRSFKP